MTITRYTFRRWVTALCLIVSLPAGDAPAADEPFRPQTGKFPPPEQAKAYDGQLVFVDHANRRGSIRVRGEEAYFRNRPHPFAMLPYGMVRYHGAPADLRDIPLGTVVYGRFYLPPDPQLSSVPVIARGTPEQPAENHALLIEDDPSRCLREGNVWRMQEVEVRENRGIIVARCEPKATSVESSGTFTGQANQQQLTFDGTTRFWRSRERLRLKDLIAEGVWPASGKKSLEGQAVLFGLTWKPTPGNVFNRYHISDLWLDEAAMQLATEHQTEVHKDLVRSRWMPAWVDAVEYGQFGRATVTATLFGGMDPSLYADFKQSREGQLAAAELTLKHSAGGISHAHMAIRGAILDVKQTEGDVPLGSSGIQIRMKVDLVLEGFRPGRIVRIRPTNWPADAIPREEFLPDGHERHEERFPTPVIFPKY